MEISAAGLDLLKRFEGCRLEAYPDPGSGDAPWTIGYGHTGAEVVPGLVITQAQAEAWLRADLAHSQRALETLLADVPLNQGQFDALLSFCFNVGAGALGRSTLRRRLRAGESAALVIREELPRWIHPLPGLIERRAAEIRHAERLTPMVLAVPYCCQNNSATAHGPRMCFSSSCAMAVEFLRPGGFRAGGQIDDQYLAIVQRYGESTEASAQLQAIEACGLTAEFRQDGTIDDLIAQLERGIPAPVGWLHQGPFEEPTGVGHWSVAIGWDPSERTVLMHDPNGEADLIGGGYVTTAIGSGKAQRYSERNWGRRWMVEGPGSGWWMAFSQP
ncbi:MAG: glycoside hydrolase family protein [Synechococcus sp. WH 8007]|nr:glycoside hydrolase family protein [Synechococcus sp. WH 8007]